MSTRFAVMFMLAWTVFSLIGAVIGFQLVAWLT